MIRLFQLPWGLVATLLAASCFEPTLVSAGPSVNIAMKAAFPSPPYLIELLETAAQENGSSYFPLLDRIADGYFPNAATDKELYDKFLEVLQKDGHMDQESLSTFKLALATRSAVPRIEAHYQYYRTAVEPVLGKDEDGCLDWVLLGGQQYCDTSLDRPLSQVDGRQDRQLPFDIVLGVGPGSVLYTDILSSKFGQFHKILSEKARNGEGSYRIRHRVSSSVGHEALPISGYGVELALKRTDYIVIDDREADADTPQKPISSEVNLDDEEEVADLKPLSTSELSELGLKAASFIVQSENPFETLLKLTQDFPKYSTSIAAHNVSADFKKEHQANRQALVPSGMNVLWMNGVQLIERQIDAFTLVDLLRRERKLIHGAIDLGLSGKQAVSLLGHSSVASAKSDNEPQRFDWRDEIEEGQVIIWLNDLEKDKRYAEYPKSLMSLLQPSMPGQLPPIQRDIFNLIFPVDLSKADDILLVVDQLQGFVKRKLPVRFGLVPLVSSPESLDQAKVVYHLLENYGLAAMVTYLQSFGDSKKAPVADKAAFDKVIKDRKPRAESTPLPFDDILQSEHHEKQTGLALHWAERLKANTPIPPLFANGIAMPRDDNWLQPMSQRLGLDLRAVQEGVYYGMIGEDTWLPGFFLEKAASRRNVILFPEDDKSLTILDVNKLYTEHHDLLDRVPVIEANPESTKENWATLSLVVDLSSEEGRRLAISALLFRANNPGVRLDIINNPAETTEAHVINNALRAKADGLVGIETVESLADLVKAAKKSSDDGFDAALAAYLKTAAISSATNMLILNGRVVGPIATAADFTSEDFQTLLEFEQANRILPVYEAIEELGLTGKMSGPLAAAKITSITALSTISDVPEGIFESAPTLRISAFNDWNSTHTAFEIGDSSTATIHLVATLNPASEQGQRWVPILKVLSELDGVYLKVFLNPKDRLDELPIKRFYRYVLESAPSFDNSGKVQTLSATFKGLPSEALLTAGMDVPPAWLVSSKDSVQDLDNIKMSSVKGDVNAIYELKHILIEGHSREPGGGPPRGVQLVLATETDPHFADTIIMANLGFFQFKANPGFYNIQLKEGRSSDIFSIESVGALGYSPAAGDEGTEAALMDFMGTTLYPRIVRKPGMENEDVLEDVKPAEAAGGAMDFVSKGLKFAEGILGGNKDKPKTKSLSDQEHAEINIFSVASGHLYERMLNIMMVSVMQHTNHTVKFWFIEQFLSPSFKDFIPHMAAEYGFKYEMVTYKWPHWLRQQKEKQREIWGYKILFLDVLFPLSLDKVIFVDADQIVRTDMYDLVQHDLDGAPYGFTPMCDSRTEMEGFRFWKQGYWANYLRGLPYHISALYVVDLRRFRELAAGDRLRQQYHTLSADPASLSNLDQDLPNHMQFQIPIHSLPQEWLWCETWCSDESLTKARTIDLCNNPQTKEPKLDRARRQVPEWTVYDDEIAALDRKRKGLAADGNLVSEDEAQKVVAGEPNTKSRRLDEPETRTKDEL